MVVKILKLDDTFENIFLIVFSSKQVLHFKDLGYFFIIKYQNTGSFLCQLNENQIRENSHNGELTTISEYLNYFKTNNTTIIEYNFDILSQLKYITAGTKIFLDDSQGLRLGTLKILKNKHTQEDVPFFLPNQTLKEACMHFLAIYENPNKIEPTGPPTTTDIES